MNDPERRKKELRDFIIECCRASSIYYGGRWPSVKYLCREGKILYVERSRKLDYVEVNIPEYTEEDEVLIGQIMKGGDDGTLIGCESHSHGDYCCYTFSLRKDND